MQTLAPMSEIERNLALERFRLLEPHLENGREYQDSSERGINCPYLELIPRHGETQSLKITKNDFDLDNALWGWGLRVPDVEDLKPSSLQRD